MYWARYLVWASLATAVLGWCSYYVQGCVEEERLALLEIQSYMLSYSNTFYYDNIPRNMLSHSNTSYDDGIAQNQWYNSSETDDCCHWIGVRCNTGRVTELDLSNKVNRGGDKWMFNVTLFQPFKHLISLDLSNNYINGLVEQNGSTKITTLKNLQVLKLDFNTFEADYLSVRVLKALKTLTLTAISGQSFLKGSNFFLLSQTEIPSLTELRALHLSLNDISTDSDIQGICQLHKLVELRLQYNLFHGALPSCFKNLSSLQILDLSNNNLSGNFPKVLSNLRSLKCLDLTNNYLEGKLSLTSLANLSKLHDLRLSANLLEVRLLDDYPSWPLKFQLQTLGLRGCNLNKTFIKTFPQFWSHQTNLSELDLSSNNLHIAFPVWLLNNSSKLRALYLKNNFLTGNLHLPHRAPTMSLQILDISNNNLHGKLPENIGSTFPHLLYLNLSVNHFEGLIPISITFIRRLRYLDLSYNNFSGELPRRILSDWTSIEVLQLSDNNLEGDIIPEDMNLPSIYWLNLSNNSFSGTIKESLLKSADTLCHLDMSNNNITGGLPQWIGKFSTLNSLLISQNNLQGQIPKEIYNLQLDYLDLSQNNLSGSIPPCPSSCTFTYLHLQNNSLTGMIPTTLSTCTSLETLDLGNNQLSGGIPLWIHKLSRLTILMLAGNNLHGPIPPQVCQMSRINILDLSQNSLSGGIPTCIGNLSFGMDTSIDYVPLTLLDKTLDATIYLVFYAKPKEVKFLTKNQLLVYKGKNLILVSSLDLSSNKLTGDIPPQLGKLEQLHSLNLSRNLFSGSIPNHFSNMTQVESLDLSFNHLSGQIPSQLIELYFLEIFNVSYNNLSGRVPNGGQFASFDERNYYGNPRLYGYNPVKALPPETPPKEDEDEDGGDHWGIIDMIDFLWSFSMSWVTMFFATILILYINLQWRGAVFDFVDSRILCWFTKFKLNI